MGRAAVNLRTLRYFVALAEELSFSRAAERLHVAQPALSQQIRTLERSLSTELVDRSHRPLVLTEAGGYLYTEALQILAACDQAALGARAIGRGLRGRLSIGFTRSSMYSVLPPALKAFHAAYPQVELKLYEMVTEEQADALHDGRIRVGIGRQSVRLEGCTSRVLLRERVMAVLPPDHPAAAADAVDIAELAGSPLILFPKQASSFSNLIESLYRDAGFIPHIDHRTFEIQTAVALVAAGLGVCFVGESVARHGRSDVVYRALNSPNAGLITALDATFRSEDASPHLRAFLDCLPREPL
ncbi:LysR substrate-binding domain-containing protein [Nocardia alni]|uniref:LysR substrate-binding domain-containing protein n=1 Tax=Nocardia alni TaxID=2815723 RepID=UPI001C24C2DB|nr:LysR substrate-binding domain-containing protein [Nocardia alni]